jgi:rRNA maturation RNase YbeY
MINFFSETLNFTLTNEQKYSNWISNCIENFELDEGEISYNFLSDEELLQINIDALNHDYYTDIITFDLRIGDLISGDIFISIDRVADNAKKYEVDFETELKRVIIHGLLHIIGFNDHTDIEKQEMRKQEELCMSKF